MILGVVVGDGVRRRAIRLVGPSRQVLELASLAAERPPDGFDGMPPAEHA
jgi:hypothetical protein